MPSFGPNIGTGFATGSWSTLRLSPKEWFRADYYALTGGLVSTWYDQSGNGNHLVQANPASWPSVIAGGTPSGRNVLHGSGNQSLPFPANAMAAQNTIGLVCTPTSGTNDYWLSGSGGAGAVILTGFGGVSFEWLGNFADRLTFSAGATGLHALLVTQVDGGALKLYFDSTTPVQTKNPCAVPLNGTSLDWLFAANLGNNHVTGDCAEFFHVDRIISDAEIALWFKYCRAYHGTP